jgi:hypothetical protein
MTWTEDELWGPGGRYDKTTVTLAKRVRCFIAGHDVREWGTQFGKWHTFPPAHKPY